MLPVGASLFNQALCLVSEVIHNSVSIVDWAGAQEFMILPVGASSFSEAMRMGAEVYHNLKSGIKKKYGQAGTPPQSCQQQTHSFCNACHTATCCMHTGCSR